MKLFLRYPKRGQPPPIPENYEATNDPYAFILKWQPCPARRIELQVLCDSCKKPQELDWCDKFNKQVTRQVCHYCKEKGQDS